MRAKLTITALLLLSGCGYRMCIEPAPIEAKRSEIFFEVIDQQEFEDAQDDY